MGASDIDRSDRRFLMLVLAAGVALRLAWFGGRYGAPDVFAGGGEAVRVAMSIARGDGIVDAHFAGSGPTAHLMPTMAAVAGGIFRLFGTGSGAANGALLGWSLAQVFVGYLLLHRLFRTLGAPPATLRWGMILLCLVPVFVPQETVDFRFWDGALAACLATGSLISIVGQRENELPTTRSMAGAALLTAVTAFVSPAAGLGVVACWGWFAVSRLPWRQAAQFAVIGAAVFAAVFGPWTARNLQTFGEPVVTRGNFGLEFAIANHSAAVAPADPARVHADRMLAIHPYLSDAARARLRAEGGEIAYARQVGAEAWAWAAAHPAEFALLSARHLSQVFAPRPWQMFFSGWEGLRGLRAAVMTLVMLTGVIGLAVGLARRRRGYATLALYVVVVALPYALVQPVPRYSYLIYGLLAFVAVDTARRAGAALSVALSGPGTAR